MTRLRRLCLLFLVREHPWTPAVFVVGVSGLMLTHFACIPL